MKQLRGKLRERYKLGKKAEKSIRPVMLCSMRLQIDREGQRVP
jgi:hypothetical protein